MFRNLTYMQSTSKLFKPCSTPRGRRNLKFLEFQRDLVYLFCVCEGAYLY